MSHSTYFKSLISLLAGSGSQLASNLLAAVLATALLPVEERGLMVLAVTVPALVSTVGGLGLGFATRSVLPSASSVSRQLVFSSIWRITLVLAGLSGVGASSVLFVVSFVTDERLASPIYVLSSGLLAGQAVVSTIITEIRFADGRFRAGANWAASIAFVGFLGQGAALAASDEALHVVAAYAVVTTASVTVSALVERVRHSSESLQAHRSLVARALLFRGLSALALPLGMVLLTRADRLVVGVFESPALLAVFALAGTVVEVARLVPSAMGQIVAREVAIGASTGKLQERLVQAMVSTLVVSVLIALSATALIPVIFGEEYLPAIPLLWLLIPAEVFYALIAVANLGLIGGGWSVGARRLAAVFAPLGLMLYVLGAIYMGVEGVAVLKSVVFLLLGVSTASLLLAKLRTTSSGSGSAI